MFLHIVTIKPDLEQQFVENYKEHHTSQLILSIAEINNCDKN